MPGNKIQVHGSTGKIKVRGSTGKIIVAGGTDACCCAPPCTLCATNGDPTTVLIRLSGFTVAAGCVAVGPGSVRWNTFDINHDFCIPKCGTACVWADLFSSRVDVDCWDASVTCAGAATANFTQLAVVATIFSSLNRTWRIALNLPNVYDASTCGASYTCMFDVILGVDPTASGTDHCLDSKTFTAASITTSYGITAGTIDIIPNGC